MCFFFFFFFNDTATTEIYTLSLHDALPISEPDAALRIDRQIVRLVVVVPVEQESGRRGRAVPGKMEDRKSTRLNSSHLVISYAVFCLKKKKKSDPLFHSHIAERLTR